MPKIVVMYILCVTYVEELIYMYGIDFLVIFMESWSD